MAKNVSSYSSTRQCVAYNHIKVDKTMAYKCKNCGKFVAKGAVICKHCGQENPAELVITNATSESVVTKMQSSVEEPIQIKCPNCGNALTLPKQFQKDYYLVCNICNQNFANLAKTEHVHPLGAV